MTLWRRWLISFCIVGAAFLGSLACRDGDDADRVLRFQSGDVTVAEFRTQVRAILVRDGSKSACAAYKDIPDDELYALFRELADNTDPNDTTPESDRERAGEVFKEECSRLFE